MAWKRTVLVAAAAAVAFGASSRSVSARAVSAASGDKVALCHRVFGWGTTAGRWTIITVPESAVPAHFAHGDAFASDKHNEECGH